MVIPARPGKPGQVTPDTEDRGTSTSITLFPGVPYQQIIHKYVFDERTQESLPVGAARDRVVIGSKVTPAAAAESLVPSITIG